MTIEEFLTEVGGIVTNETEGHIGETAEAIEFDVDEKFPMPRG